mmetsp:Transcript_62639/g.111680  ORF Transcript_62639/g.111680 Transcript_62639/m.111680 type:complete len:80 (-) Transcript_62639:1336-1575(-)
MYSVHASLSLVIIMAPVPQGRACTSAEPHAWAMADEWVCAYLACPADLQTAKVDVRRVGRLRNQRCPSPAPRNKIMCMV